MTFVAVSKIEITSSILTTSNRRMPVKIHGTELRLFRVRSGYFYYARQNFVLFSTWIELYTILTLGLFIKCTATNGKWQSCFLKDLNVFFSASFARR